MAVVTLSGGQRLQRDSGRGDWQADSEVLKVYGQSGIQQVHLQTNWVHKEKATVSIIYTQR